MAEVNDVLEARIVGQFATGAQVSIGVRHYKVTAKAGAGASMLEIAQGLDTLIHSSMKAVMSTYALYRGVGFRRILPLPVTVETATVANSGGGSVAGDPLPTQVTGIITLRTALAGPRYRGRIYLPFPSEGDGDIDGLPTGGYITRAQTLAGLLAQTLVPGSAGNTNTLIPVVYSRKYGTQEPVTSALARTKWATQRRRGAYGRPNTLPF